MPLIEGFIVGLGLVILIGPVLFTLLQITLQHGRRAGLTVAFGIFISDVIAVALCVWGAARFFKNVENQFYIGLVGAIILVSLGIIYIVKPKTNFGEKVELKSTDWFTFFMKGFLINFVNPFVFVVWLGIIAVANAKYGYSAELALYLTGTLLAILFLDTSKAFLAGYIKNLLKPEILLKLYRIIGVVLIIFGIALFIRVM